jgi:cytochrome c
VGHGPRLYRPITGGLRTHYQAGNGGHYNRVEQLYSNAKRNKMKSALFALIAASTVMVAAPAFADQALATAKNCMACHAVDKKLVGPAYKDVAAKYAGQAGAADKLAQKIMKGGSGVWGPVPMPANTQVNEAEAKKLAAWVLTLK